MVRPLTIHIARPLPTEPGGADPAPECAGTDRKTLPAQVRGEQRHRPGVGPIPKPAWIAREQLTKLVIREGGRRARPTRPGMVGKPRWHSPSKIAPNPAMDGAAVDMRTLCDRGNGSPSATSETARIRRYSLASCAQVSARNRRRRSTRLKAGPVELGLSIPLPLAQHTHVARLLATYLGP